MSFFDFKLPSEEHRVHSIKSGLFRWLTLPGIQDYTNPALYIVIMNMRAYFVIGIIALILSYVTYHNFDNSNLTKAEVIAKCINYIVPFSLLITFYFSRVFERHIDPDKYSIIKNPKTDKNMSPILVIILLPLFLVSHFQSGYNFFIYPTERFPSLQSSLDNTFYITLMSFIFLLMMLVLGAMSQITSQMTCQFYRDYKLKVRGE